VVGHLSDGERVFSYRALRFARADATDLPGFEEDEWVANASFDRRTLASIAAEFAAVRAATIALFASLSDEELLRRGTANGQEVSVRALAALLVGHEPAPRGNSARVLRADGVGGGRFCVMVRESGGRACGRRCGTLAAGAWSVCRHPRQ